MYFKLLEYILFLFVKTKMHVTKCATYGKQDFSIFFYTTFWTNSLGFSLHKFVYIAEYDIK